MEKVGGVVVVVFAAAALVVAAAVVVVVVVVIVVEKKGRKGERQWFVLVVLVSGLSHLCHLLEWDAESLIACRLGMVEG
jgi:uncharacterized membrane protein